MAHCQAGGPDLVLEHAASVLGELARRLVAVRAASPSMPRWSIRVSSPFAYASRTDLTKFKRLIHLSILVFTERETETQFLRSQALRALGDEHTKITHKN